MAMLWAGLLFGAGILLIVKGGDIFVDAASWVSDATGISKAVVGATIVSFATTSPEYLVSTIATLKGFTGLSIGNAVGSLICNLGIAFALLTILLPGKVSDRLFTVNGFIMIATTLALWFFCRNGTLSVFEGIVLLAIYAGFTIVTIRGSGGDESKPTRRQTTPREIALNAAKFIGGAVAIAFGSNLIVDNGQMIAASLGVSEVVIGLAVVAVGASLPEVVTSVSAIIKKQSALSLGNILGANILDATLILSTGAFISGGKLTIPESTVSADLPVALVLMALAVLPTALFGKTFRWQGALIAGVYVAYLAYLVI